MNANEIVKALRCHASQHSGVRGNCKDCPANRGNHELCAYTETLTEAAALIEQQEADLSALREAGRSTCKSCPIPDGVTDDAVVASLREQAERSKGCEYCDDNFKFWQTQISGELPNARFCPMCGKRLEVEP